MLLQVEDQEQCRYAKGRTLAIKMLYTVPLNQYNKEDGLKFRNQMKLTSIKVLKVVIMKGTIFWDVTQCSPLEVHRRFG
jgi:biotin synthase-like enzyme